MQAVECTFKLITLNSSNVYGYERRDGSIKATPSSLVTMRQFALNKKLQQPYVLVNHNHVPCKRLAKCSDRLWGSPHDADSIPW